MNKNFTDFIYLFSCSALGIKADTSKEYDLSDILKIASTQSSYTIIYPALKESINTSYDMEVFKKYEHDVLATVNISNMRQYCIYKQINILQQHDIDCILLKGESLAELYAHPELRISGDFDFLIDADKEEKLLSIMKNDGYTIYERPVQSNHAMCSSKSTGLIEFHLSLYDKIFEDLWFDNKGKIKENPIDIVTSNGLCYKTLGYNDGLAFVTLHFIKHFLNGGCGVRILMDMLLYMKKYKEVIDWSDFLNLIEHLGFKMFITTCVAIGIKYFQFTKNDFPQFDVTNISQKLMESVLMDMFDSGIFGKKKIERRNFFEIYTKRRFSKNGKNQYDTYMNSWRNISLINRIFPCYNIMKNITPYIENKKYLIPLAWLHRFFMILKNKGKKEQVSEFDSNRMELMENLKLI